MLNPVLVLSRLLGMHFSHSLLTMSAASMVSDGTIGQFHETGRPGSLSGVCSMLTFCHAWNLHMLFPSTGITNPFEIVLFEKL